MNVNNSNQKIIKKKSHNITLIIWDKALYNKSPSINNIKYCIIQMIKLYNLKDKSLTSATNILRENVKKIYNVHKQKLF